MNGLTLNPANGTALPYSWDANIIAIGAFFDNNYGYIGNTSVMGLLKHQGEFVATTDLDGETEIPAGALVLDYKRGQRKYYAQTNIHIMGPSFLFNLNQQHSMGIITAMRVSGGTRALPRALGFYEFDEYIKEQEIVVPKFKLAGAAWTEIGLHYGYNNHYGMSYGINVKYLMGHEGFYFNNFTPTGVIKHNNNEIDFLATNAQFGLTNTYTENTSFNGLPRNGSGLGMDLGFTYTLEGDSNGDGYQLKIGASILDLGYLSFKKNTENHRVNGLESFSLDLDDYQSAEDYEVLIEMLEQDIFEGIGTSEIAPGFSLALPTALSLQADYSFTPSVFINATLVQGIPLGKNRIARTDVFALTPRFEHRWFGAMLPINVINYDQIHVGMSLRLAYLTIGSENLMSLFGSSSEFTGTDIYLALKVNPFRINREKKSKGWRSGNKRGVVPRGRGKVKCYDF